MTTAPGAAQDNTGFVQVQGARLPYRIEGHGPPCLVIGSSIYYPRVFSQALREQLQLVFVDLRHFVESDPSFGPDRITVDTYADDIEQIRQALRLGDVVVVGHSIHGAIALEYARRYPEHVRGVVAIGVSPRRSDEDDPELDPLWAEASAERKELLARSRAELTPEVSAALSPTELWVRAFVSDDPMRWFDPSYDGQFLWEGVVPNLALMDHLYGDMFTPYDVGQGRTIDTPVLIVHGRYDYAFPHTSWEERRHTLPEHSYALFERSGHTPQLEEPEKFDYELLRWVQGLPSSSD